jgi:BspA type Leucine rich repeat region (6 copies)/Carboxypeptidase regulatory-like domain
MNHKKITVLLAALMLFSPIVSVAVGGLAGTASAAATDNYQYSFINDGTAVEITSFNCTGVSLVIPGVIAGKPVTSIGDRAFSNCTALTSVTIPNSVTTIGAEAFQNCRSLSSLTIPNSVLSIGEGAFCNAGLHTAVIPNSISVIEDNLFFGCYSLTTVTIPVSITIIGNYSFGNCYVLTGVVIPSSVTSIGIGAFSNCGLHAVVIPVSVSAVEDRCFQGCYSLTTVTIPISVTSIGNYSFYDCYALSSVTIPSNVSSLGDYLFGNCYKLMSVTVAASVTRMGVGIFSNCYDLTSIAFCGNAPSMGSGWKTGCINMTAYYFGGATGFTDPSWTGVTLYQMTSPWAPQGLTAVPADGSVSLSWKAPSGAIAITNTGYLVYRNGTYIERAAGNSVKITGLTNGLAYNFTIVTPYSNGNLKNSTSVMVNLPTVGVAVDGTALDINGNPIVNATVTLGDYKAVLTGEDGFFVFTGIKAGNYSLSITKDSYSNITQNVTAMSGKNADLGSIVLNAVESSSDGGSGSGDMTLIIIIAVIGVGAGVAVYFFFLRKR